MIRVVLMDDFMEIWRDKKHRIHLNVTGNSYERIRKLLLKNNFEFLPTNYSAGVEAIKYAA